MPCNVTYCESAVAQVSARASYDVLSLRLQARRVSVRCLPSQEEEEGQSKRSLKTKKILAILQRQYWITKPAFAAHTSHVLLLMEDITF